MICSEHLATIISVVMAIMALEEPDMPENLKILSKQHLEDVLHDSFDSSSLNWSRTFSVLDFYPQPVILLTSPTSNGNKMPYNSPTYITTQDLQHDHIHVTCVEQTASIVIAVLFIIVFPHSGMLSTWFASLSLVGLRFVGVRHCLYVWWLSPCSFYIYSFFLRWLCKLCVVCV